jgi:hypothetical protein
MACTLDIKQKATHGNGKRGRRGDQMTDITVRIRRRYASRNAHGITETPDASPSTEGISRKRSTQEEPRDGRRKERF